MTQPLLRGRRPDLYDNSPEPCPRCLLWIEALTRSIQQFVAFIMTVVPDYRKKNPYEVK